MSSPSALHFKQVRPRQSAATGAVATGAVVIGAAALGVSMASYMRTSGLALKSASSAVVQSRCPQIGSIAVLLGGSLADRAIAIGAIGQGGAGQKAQQAIQHLLQHGAAEGGT